MAVMTNLDAMRHLATGVRSLLDGIDQAVQLDRCCEGFRPCAPAKIERRPKHRASRKPVE